MGKLKSTKSGSSDQAKRVLDMATELNFFKPERPDQFDPKTITQLISTCKSESAIRAAKQGVVLPPLPETHSN
jgi:hypothetical protein